MNRTIEYRKTLPAAFFIGGAAGGILETCWTFLRHGKLIWKSGVMFFPLVNPIYGLASLLVALFALNRCKAWEIFLFSFASASLSEYLVSWAEELAFGTVSWDYSAFALNINGRVNLLYSIAWGALGLVFARYALPSIRFYSKKIDDRVYITLLLIYFSLLLFSLVLRIIDMGSASSIWITRLISFFYPTSNPV
jgi:Predicted membrane protein